LFIFIIENEKKKLGIDDEYYNLETLNSTNKPKTNYINNKIVKDLKEAKEINEVKEVKEVKEENVKEEKVKEEKVKEVMEEKVNEVLKAKKVSLVKEDVKETMETSNKMDIDDVPESNVSNSINDTINNKISNTININNNLNNTSNITSNSDINNKNNNFSNKIFNINNNSNNDINTKKDIKEDNNVKFSLNSKLLFTTTNLPPIFINDTRKDLNKDISQKFKLTEPKQKIFQLSKKKVVEKKEEKEKEKKNVTLFRISKKSLFTNRLYYNKQRHSNKDYILKKIKLRFFKNYCRKYIQKFLDSLNKERPELISEKTNAGNEIKDIIEGKEEGNEEIIEESKEIKDNKEENKDNKESNDNLDNINMEVIENTENKSIVDNAVTQQKMIGYKKFDYNFMKEISPKKHILWKIKDKSILEIYNEFSKIQIDNVVALFLQNKADFKKSFKTIGSKTKYVMFESFENVYKDFLENKNEVDKFIKRVKYDFNKGTNKNCDEDFDNLVNNFLTFLFEVNEVKKSNKC